jgi:carboxyl-terminal processing protease
MFRNKIKLFVFLGSFVIVLYGVSAAFYARDDAYKELSVFMKVVERVSSDYVETPDMNAVQEGAMRGLLDALDPYSSFLSKEQYDALQKRKENGKAGIGMVLSKRSDVIYVVSCEHDGAAEAAGIRPGDYLISVNGQDVEEKSLLEVNSLLRGSPGSKIKLTIFRGLRAKLLDFELAMKNQTAVPISSKMLDGNVGFLAVTSLTESSVEQVKVKLKTLISAGAQKLLLDLRDCADGSPADGAELTNYFVRSGIIYYSQNRQGERIQVVEANPEKCITDLPLAILINNSTAGAAEIVAGALKDQKRAMLVGLKSFGVGSDQKNIRLKSGAVLIISTAKYYTPGGKLIQDENLRNAGITPDVEAPDDDKSQDLAVESYYEEQEDAAKYQQLQEKIDKIQVDKALEVLSKEKAPLKKAA